MSDLQINWSLRSALAYVKARPGSDALTVQVLNDASRVLDATEALARAVRYQLRGGGGLKSWDVNTLQECHYAFQALGDEEMRKECIEAMNAPRPQKDGAS